MTCFLGLELLVRFEKHPKAVSGALRDRFRAREVFGAFEKRTPGRSLFREVCFELLNSIPLFFCHDLGIYWEHRPGHCCLS